MTKLGSEKPESHPAEMAPRSYSVMFFKDHGPVRTLRFSEWQKKVTLCALIGLLLLCSASLYLNYYLDQKLRMTQETLVDSQKTLFDYQSQVDGIYESIYPHLHPQPLSLNSVSELGDESPSVEP